MRRSVPRLWAGLQGLYLHPRSERIALCGARAVPLSWNLSGGWAAAATVQHFVFCPPAAQTALLNLRGFRGGGAAAAALGVVDKLHEEAAVILPADGRSSRHFWEVLEFSPDGGVVETWKTPDVLGLVGTRRASRCAREGVHNRRRWAAPMVISARPIGAVGQGRRARASPPARVHRFVALPPQHPRDVYLFASDVGQGQRAMLAARSGAILFRTDVCKAAVYSDRAVLFPCRWVFGVGWGAVAAVRADARHRRFGLCSSQ